MPQLSRAGGSCHSSAQGSATATPSSKVLVARLMGRSGGFHFHLRRAGVFRKTSTFLLLAATCVVLVVRLHQRQPISDLNQWSKLLRTDASDSSWANSRSQDAGAITATDPTNNGTAAATAAGRPAFRRYDNASVVVATKVLWPAQLGQLQQMVCLFHAAYNRHVNYDLIVFTTLPWTVSQIRALQEVVPAVRVRVVLDSPLTLSEQLDAMSPSERAFLEGRCNKKPGENLTWFHHCAEPGTFNVANLGYSWQSEFRAYHLFTMEVLRPYRYMIWMDSDAHCTKEWERDPIQLMVEHDLVLLMGNFPQGGSDNPLLLDKVRRAYRNRTLCHIGLTDGRMAPEPCNGNGERDGYNSDSNPDALPFYVPVVHGFHHVSDLDFYRSQLPFLRILVETHRFSREWDDQLAMTIPAALEAPDRAWDYRLHGIHLGIHHNGALDGKERDSHIGMHKVWQKRLRNEWPVARETCDKLVVHAD